MRRLFENSNSIVQMDYIVNRYFTMYTSGYSDEMKTLEHQL